MSEETRNLSLLRAKLDAEGLDAVVAVNKKSVVYLSNAPTAWADWLLVFLLSYISIAVYRVLRTKPASRLQLGVLITSMLFTEAVIIFFLPLIAFFYFDVKISYNLMATGVLLFIPASAVTTRIRFLLLERRVTRMLSGSANPLPAVLVADLEPIEKVCR